MVNQKIESIYYYTVALAQQSPWLKQTLTYGADTQLRSGDIVYAPFGKKHCFGVVIEATEPDTSLKKQVKIVEPTGSSLNKKTLSFLSWLEDYYPSGGSGHTQKFLPSFITQEMLEAKNLDTKSSIDTKLSVSLTDDQREVYNNIAKTTAPAVLHGITGSGKTAIYAQRIINALKEGKDALVVVPEISLVSQLSAGLKSLIPDVMIQTYHSNLLPAQKSESWISTRSSGKPTVIVGTRSALFLPFTMLGVVILDEAHDASFKEDHENSHYHGLFVGAALAKSHEAQFIIGSATPPIPETHLMLEKGAELVCLHSLAKNNIAHDNLFHIVDMNKQTGKNAHLSQLSKELKKAITDNIKNNEQTLLFMNKLGSAHIVSCKECGWQACCPRCDTNFIYHHDSHTYKCNICGLAKKALNVCEKCGGTLVALSLAIKSVEEEVKRLFPTARIARFDSSNKKAESINELYTKVRNGEYDILIGTQLMAKGFDFPYLSTVGVIQADSLLGLPDINTEERLFAQLVQVAGRVGRGHRKSSVFIQTRQPDNPIFGLVRKNDWHEIYDREIVRRKKHLYPPSVYLAKLTIHGSSDIIAKNRAHEVKKQIDSLLSLYSTEPFQAFYHKRNRKYYWHIICKSKKRDALLNLISLRDQYTDIDLDPVSLL